MSDWIANGTITKEEVVSRTILTENFESYASTGAGIFVMSQYIHTADGINQQIGGFGAFRPGLSYLTGSAYDGSPEYSYLRQGITNIYRIYNERQNPAPAEP